MSTPSITIEAGYELLIQHAIYSDSLPERFLRMLGHFMFVAKYYSSNKRRDYIMTYNIKAIGQVTARNKIPAEKLMKLITAFIKLMDPESKRSSASIRKECLNSLMLIVKADILSVKDRSKIIAAFINILYQRNDAYICKECIIDLIFIVNNFKLAHKETEDIIKALMYLHDNKENLPDEVYAACINALLSIASKNTNILHKLKFELNSFPNLRRNRIFIDSQNSAISSLELTEDSLDILMRSKQSGVDLLQNLKDFCTMFSPDLTYSGMREGIDAYYIIIKGNLSAAIYILYDYCLVISEHTKDRLLTMVYDRKQQHNVDDNNTPTIS